MKRKGLSIGFTMALLTLWSAEASDQVISRPPSAGRQQIGWFTNYDAESFRKLAAARKAIDPANTNLDLLDAAVFHASNRRRKQNGLQALAYHPKVREMARMQSRAMAQGEVVQHINPAGTGRAPEDRAKIVGLKPRMLAENVASAFGRRYKSGEPFYTREENGRKVFSYEPGGKPIPMHSYLSFAEAVVESWMQSPGHRRNLLHSAPAFLGCACEPSSDREKMETFYCTQVFFLPMSE